MKFTQTAASFIIITFLFAIPSKQDFSDAFIKVAEKGNPAIVSIVSKKVVERNFHQFLDPFGGQFPREEFKGKSLGSGVIIDADAGYIITNNHVIENAEEIKVIMFKNGKLKPPLLPQIPYQIWQSLKCLPVDSLQLNLEILIN